MRILWVLFFLICAGTAGAVPQPAPPPEYTGDQYIDGQGCVFSQTDGRWTVRTDRDGKAVCGFPPTFSARRIDPDADVLPSMHPPSEPPGLEQLLREQLATGLRQGELLADPREVEKRSEAEPSKTDDALIEGVRQMLLLKAEVSAKLAGNSGDPGLCARLGYVPDSDFRLTFGGDVTLGLCPGHRPANPEERIALGAGQKDGAQKPKDALSGSRQPAVRDMMLPVPKLVRSAARDKAGAGTAEPRREADPVMAKDKLQPEMIPASARYVQVGIFANDASAEPAIRRLKTLGYPVAKGHRHDPDRKSRVILAGPFDDRRSLVAALTLLRGKGYKAVAH